MENPIRKSGRRVKGEGSKKRAESYRGRRKAFDSLKASVRGDNTSGQSQEGARYNLTKSKSNREDLLRAERKEARAWGSETSSRGPRVASDVTSNLKPKE